MSEAEATLPICDFEGLLKQCFGNTIKINNIKWKHLTDPGENFGSLILAVTVDVLKNSSTKTLDMVVKLPPNSSFLINLFNSPITFKKELHFYENIVPALIDVQRRCGLQENELNYFVARFFGGRLGLKNPKVFDEQGAILLENLRPLNYVVKERITGLDLEHVKYAASELAKLHATIIALRETQPDFFKNVVLPALVAPLNDSTYQSVCDLIQNAYEDLKGMPAVEPYIKSIQLTIEYADIVNKNPTVYDNAWQTILHNDFWVNNILFRYNDSGQIVEMKMVDFQLCVYDCAVKDLIFFIISSAKREVLDNNLDEVLDVYYDSFVKTLKLLKVDTQSYSKEKYLELVNKCAPGRFGQCIMMTNVIQATRGNTPKMENITTAEDMHSKANNDIAKEKMLHIFQIFKTRNWLLK